jgi:hypothetical protein
MGVQGNEMKTTAGPGCAELREEKSVHVESCLDQGDAIHFIGRR